jgi:membrane protease subunit (stomatin/prohibitin family)
MAIDVVEWTDEIGDEIVHRYPSDEIRLGGQCVVRESQSAVFFRDGKALDVLAPGRHTLTTQNLPLLAGLINLPFGGKSPFKAEVYFVSGKVFTDLKWGTREPVWFRDAEFQMIQLRAFGSFSMQVTDPGLFVNSLVGTEGRFTTSEIQDFLRSVIVARLNDLLGENVDTVLNLPRLYDELAGAVKGRVAGDLSQYGIATRDFLIESITPPEEIQQAMRERASMHAVGNVDQYLKFKAASAMEEAAKQPGQGGAMGMGMAAGMGMMIPNMMQQTLSQKQSAGPAAPAPAPEPAAKCAKCGVALAAEAKFCAECGQKVEAPQQRHCTECGAAAAASAKFCPACGAKQEA